MEQLEIIMTPAMLLLIPVVAAVIQMIKNFPQIVQYKQFMPIVSLALGVGLAYLQKLPDPVMSGILIGLTASGSFDVLKSKITKLSE